MCVPVFVYVACACTCIVRTCVFSSAVFPPLVVRESTTTAKVADGSSPLAPSFCPLSEHLPPGPTNANAHNTNCPLPLPLCRKWSYTVCTLWGLTLPTHTRRVSQGLHAPRVPSLFWPGTLALYSPEGGEPAVSSMLSAPQCRVLHLCFPWLGPSPVISHACSGPCLRRPGIPNAPSRQPFSWLRPQAPPDPFPPSSP